MEKLIKKIEKLARKHGYSDINPRHFEEYVGKKENGIKTLRVFADLEDPYKNTWVQIYQDEYMTAVSWYYWSGPSGNDSLEQWADKEIWEEMVNWD